MRSLILTLTLFAVIATQLQAGNGRKPPKDDPPPPDVPSYTAVMLGTLGGNWSQAKAMNQRGDVVGISPLSGDADEPFVYLREEGAMCRLKDLVEPAEQAYWNWNYRTVSGINLDGQICIQLSSSASGSFESHAARITLAFDEDGLVIPGAGIIETVAPHGSAPRGMNEWGDVTGDSFIYSDASGLLLFDDLGVTAAGTAINLFGEVTGPMLNANSENRAFVYTPGGSLVDLGILESAGSQFSNQSYAEDINDRGVVVGRSVAGREKGNYVSHAFRTTVEGLEDLGTFGGRFSGADSINDDGAIVGWSEDRNDARHPFLYTDEIGMVYLESLITNLPGGAFLSPQDLSINDAGEISGTIILEPAVAAEACVLVPNP